MHFRESCFSRLAAVAAALLVFLLAGLGMGSSPEPESGNTGGMVRSGLAGAFEPGWFLEDRNGDQQVDWVSARIVLPRVATAEDVAAATAVVARLGLETSGLSLPLVFSAADLAGDPETPQILIGSGNELLPPEIAQKVRNLEPGQGLVAVLDGKLVIAGKDGAGTQAAAEAFSARSPYLWAVIGRQNGETYSRIAGQLTSYLRGARISPQSISFDELLYQAGRDEVLRLQVGVGLPSGKLEAARASFEALLQRHRQGLDSGLLSYGSVAEVALDLKSGNETRTIVLPRIGLPQSAINPPRRPPTRFQTTRPSGRGARPAPARKFDLAEIFSAQKGLLRDRDNDDIPDDSEMMIVIPGSTSGSAAPPGTAHLGARLGLESTGLTFPLLGFDSELEDPELDRRPVVLIGSQNRLVRELERQGKLRGDSLAPGRGRVEVVADALNESSAVVVTGGDSSGEAAALDYLARRAPHLWEIGGGTVTLEDAKKSVSQLLDGKTTAGEAALAVAEIEELLEDLDPNRLESLSIDGYFEEAAPEWESWLKRELSGRLHGVNVEVKTLRRYDPVEVFREQPELEWEVDTFRKRFAEAASSIRQGSRVSVDLRVSEAAEQRASLEQEIRSEIERRGGAAESVKVYSAFKQGLSWIMDDIIPRLQGAKVASIEIGWLPMEVDTSKEQRFYNEPARWLNELYPADDVLADRLKLPLDHISFVMRSEQSSTYQLTARDAAGRLLLEEEFSPRSYQRPYLDAFPEVADSVVTTGWLALTIDGRKTVDERIATDLDRIWDHYQQSTLKQVYDHVKSITGRSPTAEKAPYFHTLKIELEASEPDFRLGIDEEQVSAIESLHDSFYFDTLDFFYEVAQAAVERDEIAPRSLAPGNVLPWMHPERRGQAPRLEITYSGFASKDAKVVIKYREKGGDEKTESRLLRPVKEPAPYLYLAEVDSGAKSLTNLGFLTTLEDTKDLPRLTDLLENLSRFQTAGLFQDAFRLVSADRITIRLEAPGVSRSRIYRGDRPESFSKPEAYRERLVRWDHVISPAESETIAHRLGTLPNVSTYVAGRSYQGRPVSVMEIKLPMEAELISQAKLSSWKPVLSITGRQHANEVSSTSHILRLAELLASDPEYERYLHKMNVVIQPVVNPDGAALAYELQKLTPFHCLHAGRYSALGPDVPGQAGNPETLVSEALVLSRIRNQWLPDLVLNPHGYPSHEWVQHFANYNPKSFRSYWIPRGWYTSVRIPEHPGLEGARRVSLELRDRIAEEVTRDPEARQTNLRIYDRYQRWAVQRQPHVYDLEIHNDTAIYWSRTGGTDMEPPSRTPTTIFSGYTEAMDETAQGPWLDLVTRMGFGYLMASVKFLDQARYQLYRLEEERGGRIHIALTRPRPVEPGRE